MAYSRTHEDQQADDDGTAPTGHLEKQELVFNDADVAEKRERERERERDVEEGSLTVGGESDPRAVEGLKWRGLPEVGSTLDVDASGEFFHQFSPILTYTTSLISRGVDV